MKIKDFLYFLKKFLLNDNFKFQKINFHINQTKTHPCFHLKAFLKCTIEACNCNVVHTPSVLVTEPSLP